MADIISEEQYGALLEKLPPSLLVAVVEDSNDENV